MEVAETRPESASGPDWITVGDVLLLGLGPSLALHPAHSAGQGGFSVALRGERRWALLASCVCSPQAPLIAGGGGGQGSSWMCAPL